MHRTGVHTCKLRPVPIYFLSYQYCNVSDRALDYSADSGELKFLPSHRLSLYSVFTPYMPPIYAGF